MKLSRPAWITISRGPIAEPPFRRGELLHTEGGEYLLVLNITGELWTFERRPGPATRLQVVRGPRWWRRLWWLWTWRP